MADTLDGVPVEFGFPFAGRAHHHAVVGAHPVASVAVLEDDGDGVGFKFGIARGVFFHQFESGFCFQLKQTRFFGAEPEPVVAFVVPGGADFRGGAEGHLQDVRRPAHVHVAAAKSQDGLLAGVERKRVGQVGAQHLVHPGAAGHPAGVVGRDKNIIDRRRAADGAATRDLAVSVLGEYKLRKEQEKNE